MNLHDLVSELILDTKGLAAGSLFAADSSLGAFVPELVLCATVLLLLFLRLFKAGEKVPAALVTLLGALVALYFAAPWQHLSGGALPPRMEIFTGMLVYDGFSIYLRSLLFLFVALFAVFTWLSGIPDHADGPDVMTLVLGSTLGMCLMATSNHLLMVFLAVEMASVPSYVLAGLMKGRRKGSEAALKYAIYGAGAAGVMLYGISLLAGIANSAHLPTIALRLAEKVPTMNSAESALLALSGLLIGVGLAFKLSAVPFHFWAPDVFEGAPAEVGAFLSIASKAAALALLIRVALGVGWPGEYARPAVAIAVKEAVVQPVVFVAANAADEHAEPTPAVPAKKADAKTALEPVRQFTARLIAFLAIVTCTFGNLSAYGQSNIKRMLAYSTIAHAGYMMMPVAAMLAIAGTKPELAEQAAAGLGVYLVVYLFMNLGAFACVAFLRNALRSEEIADYAGLIKRAPITTVCFTVILFSLIGLPPFSGFVGKLAIFIPLTSAWLALENGGGFFLFLALLVGVLNTAVCLVYYIRVVKVMTIDDEPADRRPFVYSDVSLQGAFLWLVTVPTALLIVSWSWLNELALAAARRLLS